MSLGPLEAVSNVICVADNLDKFSLIVYEMIVTMALPSFSIKEEGGASDCIT
jgi:hypothetical protein